MTNRVSCEKAISSLGTMLNEGREPDGDIVSHWKECPRCSNTLNTLLHGLEGPDAPLGAPPSDGETEKLRRKGEAEIQRLARRKLFLVLGGALFLPLLSVLLGLFSVIPPEWAAGLVVGTATLTLIAGILAVARLPQKWGLFRRLGPGRQLGGICLGLAERTHVSVVLWRVGFVVFTLFLGGHGITIYLLLLLFMPVHPEDRQYLLKFRLARWWRGLRGMKVPA